MSKNDCATVTWAINNYSCCWQKIGEAIESPVFCINIPEETKWKLIFYPRGMTSNSTYVALFLLMYDCNGVENIKVEYSLDCLSSNGSYLNVSLANDFQKNKRNGYSNYISLGNIALYLQQDILTIRCRLFRFNEKAVEIKQIFYRSIIDMVNLSFQILIKNFKKLESGQTQSFEIKSNSEDAIMLINFAVTNENGGKICFSIDHFDKYQKFFKVKTCIIDNNQMRELDSGKYEYCSNSVMYPLKITKKQLMEYRSCYLPNDMLALKFEFTISTGFAFDGIEKSSLECTSHPIPNEVSKNWRKCIDREKIHDCSCPLIADLTSLLKDHSTCDMKLKTKTNGFPVHTLILSARSPVFKAMFSNDMKEKQNGCVDVSDLSDETVRRFLLYLYTDQLEDFEWDDALKLFRAADKYAVNSLRGKCSSFLKINLNLKNACEALMLSDLHQDKDLKESTQSFILKNAKVIFKCQEWKILADNNPKLALETTLRNWNEE